MAFAEGGGNPFVQRNDPEVLGFLGIGTEKPKPEKIDVVNLPSVERWRILGMFAPEQKPRPSFLGELRPQDPLKRLLRKRKFQVYAVEPDKPERGRLDLGKHGKSIGVYWGQEYGILDGSP